MSYIIAGLGNPGEEFDGTRHNTGRIILSALHKKFEFSDWKLDKKLNALTSKGEINGKKVQLVMPETFMNKSGTSLKPLIGNSKQAEKLVVIYDDLDLSIGSVKMAFNRGNGGHRGLESIIKALKTEAFLRVRVGISPTTPSGKLKKPIGEVAVEKCILGKFRPDELAEIKKISKRIIESLEVFVADGREAATMNLNTAK